MIKRSSLGAWYMMEMDQGLHNGFAIASLTLSFFNLPFLVSLELLPITKLTDQHISMKDVNVNRNSRRKQGSYRVYLVNGIRSESSIMSVKERPEGWQRPYP